MGMTHTVKKILKSPIARVVGDVALAATGNAEFIPALNAGASAVSTKLSGGSIGDALKSGALSYAGSSIGSSVGNALIPQSIGNALGSTASNAIGAADAGINSAIGNGFSQTASNALLNTSIGSALGSYAGNNLADGMMPQSTPDQGFANTNALTPDTQPSAFAPKQDPQLSLPNSLTGLSGLDPSQQESNLATQGVYGGGLGPDEQAYFKNLINRKLVDQSGQVAPDLSGLSSIDNSYLGQLGFSGYNNPTSLLEQLSKYGQQATA